MAKRTSKALNAQVLPSLIQEDHSFWGFFINHYTVNCNCLLLINSSVSLAVRTPNLPVSRCKTCINQMWGTAHNHFYARINIYQCAHESDPLSHLTLSYSIMIVRLESFIAIIVIVICHFCDMPLTESIDFHLYLHLILLILQYHKSSTCFCTNHFMCHQ